MQDSSIYILRPTLQNKNLEERFGPICTLHCRLHSAIFVSILNHAWLLAYIIILKRFGLSYRMFQNNVSFPVFRCIIFNTFLVEIYIGSRNSSSQIFSSFSYLKFCNCTTFLRSYGIHVRTNEVQYGTLIWGTFCVRINNIVKLGS